MASSKGFVGSLSGGGTMGGFQNYRDAGNSFGDH